MMGFEPTTFCMASRRSSQLSYIRKSTQYSQAQGAACDAELRTRGLCPCVRLNDRSTR
jgi:hypothetical protein